MPDKCRLCKQPVRLAIARQGYPIELDPDPHPNGNIWLDPDRRDGLPKAMIVPEDRREALRGELYISHRATCEERPRR
jgi:hypothetical protein